MAVSVENTSNLGRRLKVSVPDAIVKEQIKSKMTKISREAKLPGFRPGKIPAQILEKRFGPSVRHEVVNELIRQSLVDALKDNNLDAAGSPRVDEVIDKPNHDLEYTASIEVFPEITLAAFTGVEIEKRKVDISDKDVETMTTKLQEQFADWHSVERAVKKGDKLTVDFARLLKIDGATKEEQKQVQMEVGHEGVLPGLTEALLGKKIGDTADMNLTYPADWADDKAAGKGVELWVTIHKIEEKHPLTKAELAKKLGVEGDFDKMNSNIRERMEVEVQNVLQDEIKERVLEILLEKNPIEIPTSLIDQEKESIRREMSRSRRTNIPMEALQSEEVENSARKRVELGLLLNEVIKKYNLKADGQKVRAEIEKIAMRFGKPNEVIEAYYKNNELLFGIERMVLLDQAVDAILGEVTIKDVNTSFDEVMNPAEEEALPA